MDKATEQRYPFITVISGKITVVFLPASGSTNAITLDSEATAEDSALKGIQFDINSSGQIVQIIFGDQTLRISRQCSIRYVTATGMLYVRLVRGKHECSIECEKFSDNVIFDFDEENKVLGFAVINNTTCYFPKQFLESLSPQWKSIPSIGVPLSYYETSEMISSSPIGTPFPVLHYDSDNKKPKILNNANASVKSTNKNTASPNKNTYTEFLNAVRDGMLEKAKSLYNEDNQVIHQTDSKGQNAVILAASFGRIQILEWIKSEFCTPEQSHNTTNSPLITLPTTTTTTSATTSTTTTTTTSNVTAIQILLSQPIQDFSSGEDDEEEIQYTTPLISNKIQLNSYKRIDGGTPFLQAASYGQLESMKWLLLNDSENVSIHEHNNSGDTALHHAAGGGHVDVIKFLLQKGANIMSRTKSGSIPLHRAATSGHLDAVKLLIEKGSPVDDITVRRATALHYAARNNHVEVVKWLVEEAKASVTHKDGHGQNLYNIIKKAGGSEELLTWVQGRAGNAN